jgi:hypothetical protein
MNVHHGPTYYWAEFIGRLINLTEWCNTLGPVMMPKFDQLSVSPTPLSGFLLEVTLGYKLEKKLITAGLCIHVTGFS